LLYTEAFVSGYTSGFGLKKKDTEKEFQHGALWQM
jgi:hypothetical protein